MTDTPRRLIVVDLETTGLKATHVPLEIAAVPQAAVPRYFVPFAHAGILANADPDALRINRYYERGVYKHQCDPQETRERYVELHKLLTGNTLGGCNPRFDADMLSRRFANYDLEPEPWHHRLADLSAYAGGALNLAPSELPGLEGVCDMLGVENKDRHSAMGDAQATAECFRILLEMRPAAGLAR